LADYLKGLKQASRPEDVPDTAHFAILVFDHCFRNEGYGGGGHVSESVHRYYVYTDRAEWEAALSGMQIDLPYYRKPFVGLIVSAKARLITTIEIETE